MASISSSLQVQERGLLDRILREGGACGLARWRGRQAVLQTGWVPIISRVLSISSESLRALVIDIDRDFWKDTSRFDQNNIFDRLLSMIENVKKKKKNTFGVKGIYRLPLCRTKQQSENTRFWIICGCPLNGVRTSRSDTEITHDLLSLATAYSFQFPVFLTRPLTVVGHLYCTQGTEECLVCGGSPAQI